MELSWGKSMPSDLLERWPKTPSGEPEKAVFLCNCKALDLSDELKINMLEAYGIPWQGDSRDERSGHRYLCSREQAGRGTKPLRGGSGGAGSFVNQVPRPLKSDDTLQIAGSGLAGL